MDGESPPSTSSSRTSSSAIKAAEQEKPFWKNRTQHLFYFLGYCVNMRTFSSFIYEDGITNPTMIPSIIQVVLMCVIVAGPLVFIQNFIGQFTQRGCIAIGAMLPAMYGFGYCMLIVAVLDCVQTLYYSGASLLYIFTSVFNYPYPPWMQCTKEMYEQFPNCLSREDIDHCVACDVIKEPEDDVPCFEPGTRILSAKLFRYLIAFEKDNTIQNPKDIGAPQLKSSLHLLFTMVVVYAISCRRFKALDWSLRLSLIFCFLCTTVSLVLVFSHRGSVNGIVRLMKLNIQSLTDPTTWIASFRRVTEALKISTGGHVFLGSYMTSDTPSHFRVSYLIGSYLLIISLFHLHYYLVEAILQCRLNMEDYGVKSANDISFVMYPTEYGLTATPQLWSTLHFTVYWILSVVSMVLQIVLIDETISEEFKIGNYFIYTRCCICTAVFFLCLPLTARGGTFVARVLGHELKIINLFVICMTFVILFLYNIQRLNDDIHFVLNVPPTWYIQTCWILTTMFTGVLFLFQIWQYQSDNQFYLVRLVMYVLMGSPILVGFIVKMIKYLKKRNLTGLFRPSVYYGAPDLSTRMLRLLYNPRLEVRFKRRKETCKHRCLLNNEVAFKTIERELKLIRQIILDLRTNEEYKGEYSDVIAQLQEHVRVMDERFIILREQMYSTQKTYV